MDHNKEFNTALLEYVNISSKLGDVESEINSFKMIVLSKTEVQNLIKQITSLRDRIVKNIQFLREQFTLTASDEKDYFFVNQELEKLENIFSDLNKKTLTELEIENLIIKISSLRKKIIESTKNLINKFELDAEKSAMCDILLQNINQENQQFNRKISESDEETFKF